MHSAIKSCASSQKEKIQPSVIIISMYEVELFKNSIGLGWSDLFFLDLNS